MTSKLNAEIIEKCCTKLPPNLSQEDRLLFALMCGEIIDSGRILKQVKPIAIAYHVIEFHKQQIIERL